jgi:hypothetical protein
VDDASAATLAAKVPGATLTVDDSLAAGHVTLTLGTDFQGIGRSVTVATPTGSAATQTTVPGSYADNERTVADASCLD